MFTLSPQNLIPHEVKEFVRNTESANGYKILLSNNFQRSYDANDCSAKARMLLFSEQQMQEEDSVEQEFVMESNDTNVCVVQCVLTVNEEALRAVKVRSLWLKLGASAEHGVWLPKRDGSNDPKFVRIENIFKQEEELAYVRRALLLLEKHTKRPRALFDELQVRTPCMMKMLLDELEQKHGAHIDSVSGGAAVDCQSRLSTKQRNRDTHDKQRSGYASADDSDSSSLDWSKLDSEDMRSVDSDDSYRDAETLGSSDTETERSELSHYESDSMIEKRVVASADSTESCSGSSSATPSCSLAEESSANDEASEEARVVDDDNGTLSAEGVLEDFGLGERFGREYLSIKLPAPQAHSRVRIDRADEIHWLRVALQAGAASVEMKVLWVGPLSKVREHAKRVYWNNQTVFVLDPALLVFDENALNTVTNDDSGVDETHSDSLVVSTDQSVSANTDQYNSCDSSEPVATPVTTPNEGVGTNVNKLAAHPLIELRDPLFDELIFSDFDNLSLYELQTYTEARLAIHQLLIYYQRTQNEPLDTQKLERYERYCYTNNTIMAQIDGAESRKHNYKAFGMLGLCMAVRARPELLSDFIVCELLLVDRPDVISYETEESKQRMMRARGVSIERFCESIQLDEADEELVDFLNDIGERWQLFIDATNNE